MDWTSLAQSGIPSLSNKSSSSTRSYGLAANGGGGFAATQPGAAAATQQRHLPSLESAILDYEEKMLQSILTRVTEESRRKTAQMIVESNQKQWNRQRDQWLNELTGPNQEEEAELLLAGGSHHDRNGSSLLLTHSAINQQRQLFAPTSDAQRLDTELVKKHFAIVHEARFAHAQSWEIIDKFLNLAKELEMTEYATAWTIISNLSGPLSPSQRARRTAKSLGDRFREGMVHRLPRSFRMGDMKAEAVEFQSTFVLGDATVWPAVYFCLRCGDAVAAKRVLEETGAVIPAVVSLLTTLATFQGNATNIWEQDAEFPFLDGHDVVAVKDMLEAMKGNVNYSKYEAGVYGLLTGEKPFLSENVEGFSTTQDYSYSAIINALLHSEDVNEGLAKLKQEIYSLGAKHFKLASSWEFFLPLIAAQQYQQAFIWLLRIAPVQATHLALGFHKANIPIQNHGEPDTSSQVLSEILIKYSSMLEIPLVSIKYLSLMTNAYRARSEMAKIVVAQPNLFEIAGTIDAKGSREGGTLSQVVSSREEVSEILLEASSLFRSQGNNQNLVLCLFLAEQYGQVLKALSSMLVPPERPGRDRAFWINQAKVFLDTYIDTSSSPVYQRLVGPDLTILEETRILLAMNDVFATKPSKLPQILEDLLPHFDNEFIVQQNRCRHFSAPVQAAYGPLLVLRIELLQNEHDIIKREQTFTAAIQADLERNKMFSDLLIRFATSINVPPSDLHSIRQRGLMIL